MKTKMKMIVLSIAMFVAGIAATCMIGKFVIMPGIAMDISKLAYEGALNAYEVGYTDGAQKSSVGYDIYFNEEVMDEINNWEYKYIK